MELEDITLENYLKKITYSSDPNPENKLVLSNGMFVNNLILLKLINKIEQTRVTLNK